jgi:hypothetical protein
MLAPRVWIPWMFVRISLYNSCDELIPHGIIPTTYWKGSLSQSFLRRSMPQGLMLEGSHWNYLRVLRLSGRWCFKSRSSGLWRRVVLCCVMVGYKRFRGPCCLRLQAEVKALASAPQ